ncbi:MAG: ribose-phosphate pyrophosphokinase [Elusimicrobiota bacterium]
MTAKLQGPSPQEEHHHPGGRKLKVFSGNANPRLTKDICAYMGMDMGKAYVGRFSDGEINVHIDESVRGADCYVVQPTCPPVNEHLMELLIMIDALRRASASRVTAVVPYFGYARADRKSAPRVPISSKLVANLFTTAGANRMITMDLHAAQIQGFFEIPVDHLIAAPVMLDYFRKKALQNLTVVSPDVGGVERARAMAKRLEAKLAIVDKRRPHPNEASVYNIIGEVEGRTALIQDDMVDTGGTLIKVVEKLRECGAAKVYASCVHAVLSGAARDHIAASDLEEMVITDSLPVHHLESGKIKVLSIAPLMGEAILRNNRGSSISELFV